MNPRKGGGERIIKSRTEIRMNIVRGREGELEGGGKQGKESEGESGELEGSGN